MHIILGNDEKLKCEACKALGSAFIPVPAAWLLRVTWSYSKEPAEIYEHLRVRYCCISPLVDNGIG